MALNLFTLVKALYRRTETDRKLSRFHIGPLQVGIAIVDVALPFPLPVAVSANLLYGFGRFNLQNAATNGFAGRAAHVAVPPSGDNVACATPYGPALASIRPTA